MHYHEYGLHTCANTAVLLQGMNLIQCATKERDTQADTVG